jgi:hypothetical protein
MKNLLSVVSAVKNSILALRTRDWTRRDFHVAKKTQKLILLTEVPVVTMVMHAVSPLIRSHQET